MDGPLPESTLASLRSRVREAIRPACGSCHTSGLPTAKPAAVGVFDLARDDWSAAMTGKQREGFRSRTGSMADSLVVGIDSLLNAEMAKYTCSPSH